MTELNSHAQYQGRIKHLPVEIEDTNSLKQLELYIYLIIISIKYPAYILTLHTPLWVNPGDRMPTLLSTLYSTRDV